MMMRLRSVTFGAQEGGGRRVVALLIVTMASVVVVPATALGGVVSCGGETATIVGTDGPDELVGTSGPDVIAGLGGNDVIRGLLGDDRLCGNGGHDLIVGGGGSDWISGGPGRDDLRGSRSGDRIFGGPGRDAIDGGPGADFLFGGTHRDVIRGGDGNDALNGGGGSDTVLGGAGNDNLWGGIGVDFCRGELRRACESFDARLRVETDGVGNLRFGDSTDVVLGGLSGVFGEPESDTGWFEDNSPGFPLCTGRESRKVWFSSPRGSVGVLLGRDLGTVGEAKAFATVGLVTDRGIRSGDTLGQVHLSYRDVTATNDGGTEDDEWWVGFDGRWLSNNIAEPGDNPFDGFNFNSGSNGDSHFDSIWAIYVGEFRCHS